MAKNIYEDKKSHSCLIPLAIVAGFIALIMLALIPLFVENSEKSDSSGSGGTPNVPDPPPIFQKVAPTITLEQTLTKMIINFTCNDDYSYVIVEVSLLDKDKNTIKTISVRVDDCKRGETVQEFYTPSVNDMLKTRYTSYEIKEYK